MENQPTTMKNHEHLPTFTSKPPNNHPAEPCSAGAELLDAYCAAAARVGSAACGQRPSLEAWERSLGMKGWRMVLVHDG